MTYTLTAFVRLLQQIPQQLERYLMEACEANAQMLGSRIRLHIERDDLPLQALSYEWLRQKANQGAPKNHLWYTGEYLANFAIEKLRDGYAVGTHRPVRGQPGFNLPEWLERNYPVWRLTLDALDPHLQKNIERAVEAAIKGTKPRFVRQVTS